MLVLASGRGERFLAAGGDFNAGRALPAPFWSQGLEPEMAQAEIDRPGTWGTTFTLVQVVAKAG